jgi:hypothetical protein
VVCVSARIRVQAGPDDVRALTISSPAGFAEIIARAVTPVHLATPGTKPGDITGQPG